MRLFHHSICQSMRVCMFHVMWFDARGNYFIFSKQNKFRINKLFTIDIKSEAGNTARARKAQKTMKHRFVSDFYFILMGRLTLECSLKIEQLESGNGIRAVLNEMRSNAIHWTVTKREREWQFWNCCHSLWATLEPNMLCGLVCFACYSPVFEIL